MLKTRKKLCIPAFLSLLMAMVAGTASAIPEADGLIKELEQSGEAKLRYSRHAATGAVRFMAVENGKTIRWNVNVAQLVKSGAPEKNIAEAAARSFMARYGTLFGINDQSGELVTKRTKITADGRSFVRFQQVHQGLPVIAGELVVQMDAGKNILSANGETSPEPKLDITPAIASTDAKMKALSATAKFHNASLANLDASDPVLSVYNPALLGAGENTNSLVWRLEVRATDQSPIREFILIDAKKGFVALHFNQVDSARYREVYNNNNNSSIALPGTAPVRIEGGAATGIADVDDAYDYTGDTYNYFYQNHGRDSIDGSGMHIISTVKYCDPKLPAESCPYQNAFWNGSQMVFGDGFASADDVVGHELTHGVTEHESNLFYYMQSGAINESISDIFGEFIDLTNGRGNDGSAVRWLLGEDLPASIGAIRDMKNPPLYSQPDRMGNQYYYCDSLDNGGVHTNSGVNNKAAYLMTDGDTFNGKTVVGLGISKVSKIYYEADTNLLTSGSGYDDLYDILQLACQDLAYTPGSGVTSADCVQVKNAVDAVEMNTQSAICPSPVAPVCIGDKMVPVNTFFDDFESGAGNTNWTVSDSTGQVWGILNMYASSGIYSLYGDDFPAASDTNVRMSNAVTIPYNAYLHFRHSYYFEYASGQYYDGGVVEYSTDGGVNWNDALPLFDYNGYGTSALQTAWYNPLGGRRAFEGSSFGYMSSRLNLSGLAGQNTMFRFRIGTDNSGDVLGWIIDDVRIYTCASDTAGPTGSIIINSGAASTSTTSVTLTISATDNLSSVAAMQFSNDNANWSDWENYGTSKSYTLTSGDGLKTVYARFKDGVGNISTVYSDTITFAGDKTLTLTMGGSGGGAVTGNIGGINCTSGTCIYNLAYGSAVTLTAGPNGDSLFSGWSGACTGPNPVCGVTMDANKSTTAAFTYVYPARVEGSPTGYSSLAGAYAAVAANGTIMARQYEFIENLTLGVDKSFTFDGGYDLGYNAGSGYTTLKGILTVQRGSMTVKQLVLK